VFYTIYKITNLLNNNIYIGKHQTKDLNDGYMGSGKYLKRSVNKHGLENFKKEILFIFDSEKEMDAKEAELVDEEFILREDTYNICVGGQGGFSYINTNGLSVNIDEQRKKDKSLAKRSSSKANDAKRQKYQCQALRKEYNKKISNGVKTKIEEDGHWWTGKAHSDQTKEKMKKTKNQGEKNSQFGTMWITNGDLNKKIKRDVDNIPEGWYKGRSYFDWVNPGI